MTSKFDIDKVIESRIKSNFSGYDANILNPINDSSTLCNETWYRIKHDDILCESADYVIGNGTHTCLKFQYDRDNVSHLHKMSPELGMDYDSILYGVHWSLLNRQIINNLKNYPGSSNYLLHKIPLNKSGTVSSYDLVELYDTDIYASNNAQSIIDFIEHSPIDNIKNLIFRDFDLTKNKHNNSISNQTKIFKYKYFTRCYFKNLKMITTDIEIFFSVIENCFIGLTRRIPIKSYDVDYLLYKSVIVNSNINIKLEHEELNKGVLAIENSEFFNSNIILESEIPIEINLKKCNFHNTSITCGKNVKIIFKDYNFTNNPMLRPSLHTANEINQMFDNKAFMIRTTK